jgi:quercetin dioxygenase-like cupin family protein
MTGAEQTLVVLHEEDIEFESAGLRKQFVYRDLGIGKATGGHYSAHVIRAGSDPSRIEAHMHTGIQFQLVYVIRGTVTFWYEGRGTETLKAGSVHLLPPGIKHSVESWSDDLEMVEITSPKEYETELVAEAAE